MILHNLQYVKGFSPVVCCIILTRLDSCWILRYRAIPYHRNSSSINQTGIYWIDKYGRIQQHF